MSDRRQYRQGGGELLLVRHGETVGNSSIRYYGRTDLALSEAGRAQMRAARGWIQQRFGAARFARVCSSPMRRALEGAEIIAGPAANPIQIKQFVEVDFGLFEGLTAEEIRERHPLEYQRWERGRLDPDFTYPGGESRAAFTHRVAGGIKAMLEVLNGAGGQSDRPSLLIAHRGVIRTIMRQMCGVEPEIGLGSIQVLRRDGGTRWTAEQLDTIEHLRVME